MTIVVCRRESTPAYCWVILPLIISFSVSIIAIFVGGTDESPAIVEAVLPDGVEDVEYNFTLTATDPDDLSTELSWSDDTPLFDIDANGSIAFTPENGDVGLHSFNVTVSDPGGLMDIHAFTLFIANVNDRPELAYIPPQFVEPGVVFMFDVSMYLTDPDLLIPLEWRDHITYRDDTPKLDTNLETGIITWDKPTNDDVGDFYFKITVQDSKGRYDDQEVKITVMNIFGVHMIGTIPRQVLYQDHPYSFDIPVSHPEPDTNSSNESLTFSNDHHELFVIDAVTGRIHFTPSNGQVGIWTVNITMSDQYGAFATKRVRFDVMNRNDPPVLALILMQHLTEDVPFELQVRATDADMEPRLLDGSPVDPDEHLEFSTNLSRVTIDREMGLISFTPTNDDALRGDMLVEITVADRWSRTSTAVVLFKVLNINDPPSNLTIGGMAPGQHLQEGWTFQLSGNATDIDNAPEQLSYCWYAGSDLIGEAQALQWKVAGHGPITLQLRVSDNEGGMASLNVTVDVIPARTPWCLSSYVVLAAFVVMVAMTVALARHRRKR